MTTPQTHNLTAFLTAPRIKFAGTGGVYDYELGNSSAIVKTTKGNVLIDCGYSTFIDLSKKGAIDSIDYLLITHIHGDHAGGLHPCVLHWANRRGVKIKIICPTESYEAELRHYMQIFLLDVDKYVEFVPISEFGEIGFVDTKDRHVKGIQSFAYYFNLGDQFLYYSGDLGDINATRELLEKIEHPNIVVFHEVVFIRRDVHVYYKDLEDLADEYSVFAYHCNPADAPEDCRLRFVENYPELKL